MDQTPFFPMFVSLSGRQAAVIGGGQIACRRVSTLLSFGCRIRVISPELCPKLLEMAQCGQIQWEKRTYQQGDLDGAYLAVAAADCRQVNHAVYLECRQKGVLASIADCKEECDFYFPAVIRKGPMVIGVNGGGGDHRRVRLTADWLREHQEEIFTQGEQPMPKAPQQEKPAGKEGRDVLEAEAVPQADCRGKEPSE